MAQLTLSSSLVLLFAVLVPRFMQEVLAVRPDDAVYIFAPTGVGAILGLRLLPRLAQQDREGPGRRLRAGRAGGLPGRAGAGPEHGRRSCRRTEDLNPFGPERLGGLSLLVALTMIIAGPLGLAYAMVNAPAQTVLHERAPPEMRGRVFGAQLALASLAAIIPLLLVGAVADIYGVSFVLFAIAVVVAAMAGLSLHVAGPTAEGGAGAAKAARQARRSRAGGGQRRPAQLRLTPKRGSARLITRVRAGSRRWWND